MTDSDGSIDGGRPDAATILAAVAIVAGLALAVAGVASVAANWSRIPLRPDAVLAALPLSLRVGVPLAALGVGCGGASGVPSVPLSPTGRQRRVLVAGALVAGSGAVTGAVPVLGELVRLGLTPDALGALPAVVGWTLIAAGLGGGALPEPVRTRATRLATGAYARVVGATAGPLPPALRRGLLAAGAVVVGLGGVLARPSSLRPGTASRRRR